MKTILLAGYRRPTDVETAPGLDRLPDGTLVLDHRIAQLRGFGYQVVCVLSGAAADEQIRRSRLLADVELVFDTSVDDVSLVSNVRAGLVAVGRAVPCFVLPVEITPPERRLWTGLLDGARTAGANVSLAQAVHGDRPFGLGFPLLVTRFGADALANLDDLTSLADARLEYLHPSI